MSATALAVWLVTRVPVMPRNGILEWVRTTSAELQLTLTVVAGVGAAIVIVIVFLTTRAIGKTILAGVLGALVTFLVGGGLNWLSQNLGNDIQG